MPCYDPPMPWEAPRAANNAKAADMLCTKIKELVRSDEGAKTLTQQELLWFKEHRELDAMRAHTLGEFTKYREASEDVKLAARRLQELSK